MLNTIRALEQIQRIDLEIKAIHDEEKNFIEEIDKLTAEIKKEQDSLGKLSAEHEELKNAVHEIDEKIRESTERVSKDEKRLNSIKNDKELNALSKEITNANKTKKQGEQEKTSLNSKLDDKKASLDAKEACLKEKNERLVQLTNELDGKRNSWKEALVEKNTLRDSVKEGVKPEVLKKYELIKTKRGGLGIVLVQKEICQGCFMHIPPQVYIQLKKGLDELMSCPHCHRILYVENQNQLEAV